jgi:hypothetical protein
LFLLLFPTIAGVSIQIPNSEGNRDMKVRKVVTGSVLAAGLGVAGLLCAGAASADASANATDATGTGTGTDPTLNYAMGFGNVNHMSEGYNDQNGEHNGIGWLRSDQSNPDPNTFAGTNRVRLPGTGDPNTINFQAPTKVGNGRN